MYVTFCDFRIVWMDQQFTFIQSIKPLSHGFIPALVLPTHSATISRLVNFTCDLLQPERVGGWTAGSGS